MTFTIGRLTAPDLHDSDVRRATDFYPSARCADPDVSAVTDFVSDGAAKQRQAEVVCGSCHVKSQCASWFLDSIASDTSGWVAVGTWGGITVPFSGARRVAALALLGAIADFG